MATPSRRIVSQRTYVETNPQTGELINMKSMVIAITAPDGTSTLTETDQPFVKQDFGQANWNPPAAQQ
jgi:hypothetical protein